MRTPRIAKTALVLVAALPAVALAGDEGAGIPFGADASLKVKVKVKRGPLGGPGERVAARREAVRDAREERREHVREALEDIRENRQEALEELREDRQELRQDLREARRGYHGHHAHGGATIGLGDLLPPRFGHRWVEGRYEVREFSRLVPAETRREWVPERTEEVVIPAVIQRVPVPAVVERVWCPPVTERVWVPGHYDETTDHHGRRCHVWVRARYEERVVAPGHWEDRVMEPECWEDRIVTPARRECRVVEPGHWRDVIVCPARTEIVRERVWVPGQWVRC